MIEQCSLESRTIRWVFARDEAARDLSICNDDDHSHDHDVDDGHHDNHDDVHHDYKPACPKRRI